MLQQNGTAKMVEMENGMLMILSDWKYVYDFSNNVKYEIGAEVVFLMRCDNANLYYIKTKNEDIINKIKDYAIFGILPNRPCLD